MITRKVRTFLGAEDISAGPHNSNGLFQGEDLVSALLATRSFCILMIQVISVLHLCVLMPAPMVNEEVWGRGGTRAVLLVPGCCCWVETSSLKISSQ